VPGGLRAPIESHLVEGSSEECLIGAKLRDHAYRFGRLLGSFAGKTISGRARLLPWSFERLCSYAEKKVNAWQFTRSGV
jgi:hypothetical protein